MGAETMQDRLSLLSTSLDNIRSQPMIIDLTKKRQRNDDLSQQLIGRQMKLRDYRLKYEKIQANINNANVGKGTTIKHGTILVDHEVEYSSLLQQTVQSLRRKVTQLTMSKKLTNCELNLKPLPFVLLRDEIISKIHRKIKENEEKKENNKNEQSAKKKKMKRVKKEKKKISKKE